MIIPDGWKKIKFDDVVNKINDKVPNRDEWTFDRFIGGEHFDEGEIRVTRSAPIEGNEEVIGSAFHMRFKPGQVLYVTRNPRLRKGGIVDFEGVCSNVSFVMEVDEKQLLQSLLPFIIQTEDFVKHTCNNAHGSTNPFLNWKDIAKYEFLLPPLEEQKKIMEVLWDIENCKKDLFFRIQREKLFQKKYIENIITDGVNNKGWKIKKMEEITSLIIVGFVGAATSHHTDSEEGVAYLQNNNVRRNKIDIRKVVKVTKSFSDKHKKSIVQEGDMLTVQAGHAGESCIVPKEFVSANCCDLIISRFNKEIVNPYYACYYLNCAYGESQLSRILVGSTIKHVNVKDLKSFKLPVPSLKEQIKIAEIIKKMELHLEKINNTMESLTNLRRKLSNELLSGKLRLN
jgi:type I restriction enzyme, S subunit